MLSLGFSSLRIAITSLHFSLIKSDLVILRLLLFSAITCAGQGCVGVSVHTDFIHLREGIS